MGLSKESKWFLFGWISLAVAQVIVAWKLPSILIYGGVCAIGIVVANLGMKNEDD